MQLKGRGLAWEHKVLGSISKKIVNIRTQCRDFSKSGILEHNADIHSLESLSSGFYTITLENLGLLLYMNALQYKEHSFTNCHHFFEAMHWRKDGVHRYQEERGRGGWHPFLSGQEIHRGNSKH